MVYHTLQGIGVTLEALVSYSNRRAEENGKAVHIRSDAVKASSVDDGPRLNWQATKPTLIQTGIGLGQKAFK